MQKASISPRNLHKQVICISYVILENVQKKIPGGLKKTGGCFPAPEMYCAVSSPPPALESSREGGYNKLFV